MSKLGEMPEVIVIVADVFRRARGMGPWSIANLPGEDAARALEALAAIDRHLASTPSAEVEAHRMRTELRRIAELARVSGWTVLAHIAQRAADRNDPALKPTGGETAGKAKQGEER